MSSLERKTILLVEDEGIIAMTGAKTIERFGYRVIVANSGEKAVRLAFDDKSIGLVLMDINLGKGIDGTEAARQILSKRTIPIVFLTSHSEKDYVDRVKEITRYGYVIKDSGDVVLKSSIEMAFELFHAHENVERKNQELARINRKLQQKEEEYRLLFESAPSGIFIAQEGKLKLANPAALDIMGHSRERLASEPFASFIHPEDRDMAWDYYTRRLNGEMSETDYPFRIITAEGTIKWVEITPTPISWKGTAASLNYILEVTERKRAEEALRESEVKYRAAFLTSPDSININTMDGRYVAVNEGFVKLTGFTREEVIGALSSELGIWAIPEDRIKLIRALNETGVVENMESVFRCKDGSLKTALMSARTIDISNEPYILSITRDITERKEAEEKEHVSERKYRILADNTYDWEYWLDPRFRFIYCSPSCERITGHMAQEFLADPNLFKRIIHPDHRPAFVLHRKGERKTGQIAELEFLIVRPDGTERWIGHVCQAVYDENGVFAGIRGSNRDITDRKKAEEALKESEEKYRSVFTAESDALFLLDKETGAILDVNDTACCLYGYTREEMLGLRNTDMSAEPEETAQATKEFRSRIDLRFHKKKNGTTFPVDISASLFALKGRQVILAAIRDVTDREFAENALKQAEQALKVILDAVPAVIWQKDTEGRYVMVNQQYCNSVGLSKNDVLGKTDYEIYPQDIADQYVEDDRKVLTSHTPQRGVEVRYRKPSGDYGWSLADNMVFYDTDGNAMGTIGFALDITERKEIEKALKESEARWQFALEGADDGVWDWDAVTNRVYFSPRWKTMLGYAEDEIGNTLDDWDRRVHPDDKAKAYEDLERHFRGESSQYENEHRMLCRNGSYKWILARGKVIEWAEDGKPRRIIGTHSDITDRKRMEEALRESQERLRGIIFSAADWVWEVDRNGVYTYSSEKGLDILGRSPQDIIGKTPFDFMPPDEAKRMAAIISEIVANKAPIKDLENWNIARNGEKFCLLTNGLPILDEEGNLKGYRGVDKDITDRKKAEEQIKSLLAEKELLLKEVHHRIKNNMNVIMSLLSLQSSTLRDNPSTVAALQDAKSRVQSMMILYEKIYRSSDFRKISTRQYIASLIDEIMSNFPNRESVTIKKHIDDFLLDARTLSPVGMILNELLTNAMKYAFTDRDKGTISVSLSRGENHVTLVVGDNGIGIPESTDIATSTGFGLQVVEMLTEQLEGTIRIERNRGSMFILEFDI